MLGLITTSIEAHGGIARWKQVRQISATLTPDGATLKLRGQQAFAKKPTRITVDTRLQRVTLEPFLADGQIGCYSPFRAAVETLKGVVVEGLDNPRNSFAPDAPWTRPQLAYFIGYSLWTYFNLPFGLLTDGVQCEEIEPLVEDAQTWRALKVTFPRSYVTHSSEQILYFDEQGLIRRQDYFGDIAGSGPTSHYFYDYLDFGGMSFPARLRAFPRAADGQPNRGIVLLAADFQNIETIEAEINDSENWCVSTCD